MISGDTYLETKFIYEDLHLHHIVRIYSNTPVYDDIPTLNSLLSSDTIWQQGSGSTWTQVMVCCWWHQAITWTNIDLSSIKSSDIHQRTISQEILQPSVTKISLKSVYFNFHWNLPGANELIGCVLLWFIPGEHLAMFFMDIYGLTHWGQDNMAAIFRMTFWNGFSWMTTYQNLKFVPSCPIYNIPRLI